MPVSDPASPVVIELSRAEQWVAHHVLLDSLGLADGRRDTPESAPASDAALDALETLESGTYEFGVEEVRTLQRACREHARATEAVADRNLATAVSDRIGAAIGSRDSVHGD